jgi:hypothetical protein
MNSTNIKDLPINAKVFELIIKESGDDQLVNDAVQMVGCKVTIYALKTVVNHVAAENSSALATA